MELEINAEELSLLLDLLANAGADDQLPSGLLSFFFRVTSAWNQVSRSCTESCHMSPSLTSIQQGSYVLPSGLIEVSNIFLLHSEVI